MMLGNDEEQKEIVVKAPSKPVVSSEKKVEKAAVQALEEERYNVFQVNKKVGKYLGGFSAGVGVVLLVFLAYVALTSQGNLTLLSFVGSAPFVGLWVLVGLISVIVGFLLIGSE